MLATCRYTLRQAARRSAASHTRAAAEAAGSSTGAAAAGAATQAGTAGSAATAAGAAWRAALQQGDMERARGLSLPVGVLAGIFGSVAGSGGAAVIAPLLSKSARSIPQRVVAGTSLTAVLATAITSTATFTASGCVDPAASALVCAPAVLLAPLGARLASRLDCAALRRMLGYFLVLAAPLIPLKAWMFSGRGEQQPQQPQRQPLDHGEGSNSGGGGGGAASSSTGTGDGSNPGGGPDASGGSWAEQLRQRLPRPPVAAGLLAAGGAAGFASGLLGIGGGTVATPLVALLLPYGQAAVLGTTLLAMIPPTAVGILQHHRLGNIDWRLAALLSAGAVVGAAAGSAAAVHSPPGALEACFTGGMLVLARMTLRPLA